MRAGVTNAAAELFPPLAPHATGRLQPDGRHSLYWEVSGNPQGVPVLFLHGGPGAGASADHRRFFDPSHYRIVIFDQRGAGRSLPLADVTDNTTQHLIADIELLREQLRIERWQVFGGSWGSTLALAYAEAHPARVSALVLRGIFLCRQREIDWFLTGMRQIFPEAWRRFIDFLPDGERADPLAAYYRRLTDPNPTVHGPAAKVWSHYEASCSTLLPHSPSQTDFADPRMALGLARIEAHYFVHRGFMAEGALLDNIAPLRRIPGIVIQGRYDIVCPTRSADDLARAWPEADYQVVPDAGHSAMEPGIRRALVAATERFKGLD
ncbi:MAG TPA: prolyl aminopeptidase [Kiloniellaceae bacterium]|nr:prolyl aminopeptidase [Kiloniellaceae bacterium]